jgi:general secretion pathway protein G
VRARRQLNMSRIFFPWESRGGLVRRLRLGRVRPYLLGGLGLSLLVVVGVRDRRAAGIRQTRAEILDVRRAVDAYLAERDGGCPPSLEATQPYGAFQKPPRDAWGKPLRLVCPGKREGSAYELMSDGPDGLAGGLDRIE